MRFEKLIIANKTDMPMSDIIKRTYLVVKKGRTKKGGETDSYPDVYFKDGIVCSSFANTVSDRFEFTERKNT